MKDVFRTRIEVWSDMRLDDVEIEDFAGEVTNGSILCSKQASEAFPLRAADECVISFFEPEALDDLFECQNCGAVWPEHELLEVKDVLERVAPGEPMPAGECPKCGAVCHPHVLDQDAAVKFVEDLTNGRSCQSEVNHVNDFVRDFIGANMDDRWTGDELLNQIDSSLCEMHDWIELMRKHIREKRYS
jgi:hypothetical protein